MKNLNAIGLDIKKSKKLSEQLNVLLANYAIFYQNVRGYHWNIKGEKFFELHLKFEELYNDLFLKIDEVAERILTLGYAPWHRYSDYKTTSTIKESSEVTNGLQDLSCRNAVKTSTQARQTSIFANGISDCLACVDVFTALRHDNSRKEQVLNKGTNVSG